MIAKKKDKEKDKEKKKKKENENENVKGKERQRDFAQESLKNEYKKMLVLSFSHQFKTPLNSTQVNDHSAGTLTILFTLRDQVADSRGRYPIDAAITSVKLLEQHINDCLVHPACTLIH